METIVEWVNAGAPVEGDRDPLTETVLLYFRVGYTVSLI